MPTRALAPTPPRVPLRTPAPGRAASRRARVRALHSSPSSSSSSGAPVFHYHQIEVETRKGIHLHDITSEIESVVKSSGVVDGYVNVLSRHTTTAVCINEAEGRLLDDVRQYLARLAPADHPYLHNDLHLRRGPPGWPGGDEAWRAQEPENAHSHLLSMLLGNSETVPVVNGELMIGTWQSVMLVELDGPRRRTVGVQAVGVTRGSAELPPSDGLPEASTEEKKKAETNAKTSVDSSFDSQMDEFCEEDPSADECRVFD